MKKLDFVPILNLLCDIIDKGENTPPLKVHYKDDMNEPDSATKIMTLKDLTMDSYSYITLHGTKGESIDPTNVMYFELLT